MRSHAARTGLGSRARRAFRPLAPALLASALLVAACTPGEGRLAGPESGPVETSDPETTTATSESTEIETETGPDPVEAVLKELSVEEKIGQLLMPVMSGSDASRVTSSERNQNLDAFGFATPAEIVEAYHLGGVIYFEDTNVKSAEQLRGFTSDLQRISYADTDIGLLVAIDQEGGRVNRVQDEVTIFPSAASLAGNLDGIVENSYVTGQQVRQQGVNVVLAPVADVLSPQEDGFIGDRSFGSDPDLVADMVRGSVAGLQQSGVAAAVKHWPGHGATPTDSHQTLPVIDISREEWEDRERIPFQAALDEDVAIVLVGHLALPQLDASGLPATVSPVLIDGLLRQDLGYEGVVMSDSLAMGALDDLGEGEVAVSALLAGIDILLIPPDVAEAYEALVAAADSGRISAERLDDAVTRVLRLKADLGLLPEAAEPTGVKGEPVVGDAESPDSSR